MEEPPFEPHPEYINLLHRNAELIKKTGHVHSTEYKLVQRDLLEIEMKMRSSHILRNIKIAFPNPTPNQ